MFVLSTEQTCQSKVCPPVLLERKVNKPTQTSRLVFEIPWTVCPRSRRPRTFFSRDPSLVRCAPDRCFPTLDCIIQAVNNHNSYSQKLGQPKFRSPDPTRVKDSNGDPTSKRQNIQGTHRPCENIRGHLGRDGLGEHRFLLWRFVTEGLFTKFVGNLLRFSTCPSQVGDCKKWRWPLLFKLHTSRNIVPWTFCTVPTKLCLYVRLQEEGW